MGALPPEIVRVLRVFEDAFSDLHDVSPALTTAITIVLLIVAAVITERILIRLLRRAYWRREAGVTGASASSSRTAKRLA